MLLVVNIICNGTVGTVWLEVLYQDLYGCAFLRISMDARCSTLNSRRMREGEGVTVVGLCVYLSGRNTLSYLLASSSVRAHRKY